MYMYQIYKKVHVHLCKWSIEKYMYMYYNKTIEKEQQTDKIQEETKMKVQLTSNAKKVITVDQMPAVRKVIECAKADEITVKEYAKMAASIISDSYVIKVLEASAQIFGNYRVWDWYEVGSAQFDVWVEFTAMTDDGFVMGGAYVSDIHASTGDNHEELRKHMYFRKFKEVK